MDNSLSFSLSEEKIEIKTFSEKETERLGTLIASCLEGKELIFLIGELGSGKTSLTRGIVAGAGISKRVRSPSFVLVNHYKGENLSIHHIDLYRTSPSDMLDIGLEELIGYGVVIIEWADRLKDVLTPSILIKIDINKDNERTFNIEGSSFFIKCLEKRLRGDAYFSDRYLLVQRGSRDI